ncbi:hypothetical protein JET18_07255 [Chryseobacterium sp. L7]|uniref:HTH luxR-type domain-containing protein n=1 Tax=Chryseobacterium endalhagicum TaxID=2797638 RepID=A0ABS1QDD7_9FLAO|nr:tetratricopeptide repeat protein [Chryseobacterium endalhagicum]MBL1220630.1 hypothetical protein [Chryseobacterium endalhagicum]
MKKILYVLVVLLILACADSRADENMYFHKLTNELTQAIDHPAKISALQHRELKNFKNKKDKKYLIGSKYIELFLYRNDRNKQILFVYDLLKLNDSRYDYISMTSYYSMAIQLESTSPELAMHFIDKAIGYNKTLSGMYYAGHLYHMKGRFYYNKKAYASALYYFEKALKNFRQDDLLYTSSMHNNFGMAYAKLNNMGKAVQEAEKGIEILKSKKDLTKEEFDFLIKMKGNLGFYYYELKDYSGAEKLLVEALIHYGSKKELFSYMIPISEKLFDLYVITGQLSEQKKVVDHLLRIEPQLTDTYSKITVNEIVQKYYYSSNADIQLLKEVSKKLIVLNHTFDDENRESIQKTSDLLNKNLISSINDKYGYEIKAHKRKVLLTIMICCLLVVIIGLIALYIWTKKKSERKDAEKQREILEANKKILERDILFQKEKIKNLYQNLNLKIESEKAFLQNIKKIKRSADNDHEQILRDLHLKVGKLIQIDKKNDVFVHESSSENKIFLSRLEQLCPDLTNRELKLCTYFRMDLSSKEISVLEDTTTATVRVYKTRIKSKLGLARPDNLSTFLGGI